MREMHETPVADPGRYWSKRLSAILAKYEAQAEEHGESQGGTDGI